MKKKYQYSIIIVLFVVFAIIMIVSFFLKYTQNLIKQSISMNLEEITKQDAEKLENRIQEHKRILETISNEVEEKAQSEEEIFNIYNRNSGNEEFSRIAILYKNGNTITSDGKNVDLSEDVNRFFSNSEIQISRSRKSKVDNEEINIYSKKIKFKNEDIVILLVIDNEKYKNLFTQNIFYGSGIECIIASDGEIISNSMNEENGSNFFEDLKIVNDKENNKIDKMKTEILENDEGQVDYQIQGNTYYISYQKLNIEDWVLTIIISENIIAKDLIQLLEIIVISAMVIVIITFLVTLYIVISNIKKKNKLYKLAYVDPITNLGNYNAYLKEIQEKKEINNKNTIIILDVDKFKAFNKKYGHIKGNQLLKRIGDEIKNSIRKTDIVCRLGNDVYGIFLTGEVEIKNIIKRLNANISRIKIQDEWYNIRISIGIYISKGEEKDIRSMIDKAIIAHDSVKGRYNEQYGVYTEEFEEKISKENEIETIMNEAIKNEEFEVYYQPQISTKTKEIEGAEALVRWNRNGNIIPPNDFIPLFEKNLFIIKLDEYIYEAVCKNIKEMKKKLKKIPKISVNVSRESLVEKDFFEKYIKIAKKYNVMPNEIEIEITERTTVDDNVHMKDILQKVKEKGFGIAIDDFGTGYSSLNMLEELPIDTLKIDKSFIDKIDKLYDKTDLIEIIILITKKMKLKTVAEGVEKKEQVEYLKRLNCDLIQGYFYSKPLKYKDFEKKCSEK